MNTFLYKAPWSLKSASTVNFRPRVNSCPPGFVSQVPRGSQCPPGLPWDMGFWPPAVQDQVKCIHQSSTTRCPMETGWENPLPHMSPLGESCHLCLAWVHTSRLRCSRVFSPAGQPPTQASFSSWPPESCRPHSRQRCLVCIPAFRAASFFSPASLRCVSFACLFHSLACCPWLAVFPTVTGHTAMVQGDPGYLCLHITCFSLHPRLTSVFLTRHSAFSCGHPGSPAASLPAGSWELCVAPLDLILALNCPGILWMTRSWVSILSLAIIAGTVPRACELCKIEYFKILETSISSKVL